MLRISMDYTVSAMTQRTLRLLNAQRCYPSEADVYYCSKGVLNQNYLEQSTLLKYRASRGFWLPFLMLPSPPTFLEN